MANKQDQLKMQEKIAEVLKQGSLLTMESDLKRFGKNNKDD